MAGVESQGPFLPAALHHVSCRLLGCRLANMQPGSRSYAWLFFYWIRGVHAGQGSPVGGHLLLLAEMGGGGEDWDNLPISLTPISPPFPADHYLPPKPGLQSVRCTSFRIPCVAAQPCPAQGLKGGGGDALIAHSAQTAGRITQGSKAHSTALPPRGLGS